MRAVNQVVVSRNSGKEQRGAQPRRVHARLDLARSALARARAASRGRAQDRIAFAGSGGFALRAEKQSRREMPITRRARVQARLNCRCRAAREAACKLRAAATCNRRSCGMTRAFRGRRGRGRPETPVPRLPGKSRRPGSSPKGQRRIPLAPSRPAPLGLNPPVRAIRSRFASLCGLPPPSSVVLPTHAWLLPSVFGTRCYHHPNATPCSLCPRLSPRLVFNVNQSPNPTHILYHFTPSLSAPRTPRGAPRCASCTTTMT